MGRGAVAVLRAAVRRVPLAILAIAGVIALACAIVLACRYYQTRASGLARREPPQQLAAAGDATPLRGDGLLHLHGLAHRRGDFHDNLG